MAKHRRLKIDCMRDKWRFENNAVFKNENLLLNLDAEVLDMIVLHNDIILLLKSNATLKDRNVFCYDTNGSVKWQIPAPISIHKENDFTGIYLRDSELYAYNRSGVEYNLDIETGRVKASEFIR